MAYITIMNKNVYYEICGAEYSNTLLYLHGGPGASCLDFTNQAKALGKKMRTIIFDQLGVLRSDAISKDEDYSMEYQIEMLEEMRKSLGIEKWSILGHSYGGMLAVLYAFRYPTSIHKMILECPSLWFENSAKSVAEYVTGYIDSLQIEAASKLCEKIKATDYQGRPEIALDLIALLNYVTDQKLRNYLHGISYEEYQKSMDTNGITEEMWSKGNQHVMKLLEMPMQNDSSEKRATMLDNFLPMIQKETLSILLINGRYDPACSRYQIEYMLNNVQDITQVTFENSGHFPRIEEAELYTDTVLGFLEV